MRILVAGVVMTMLLPTAMADTKSAVQWIAHRGASHDAPENTLSSFRLAWQQGVDACENDIHLTEDGKVIVCHDKNTLRTTGGDKKGKKLVIKDSTADQLRVLDVGSWKGAKFAGEKLPLLEECLGTIPDGKRFFVEIKSGIDVVPAAVDIINKSSKRSQVTLISFHADALEAAKKALPDCPCFLIASFKKDKAGKWSPTVESLIETAKWIHADGLDLGGDNIDKAMGDKVKAAGLGFYVWTIDDPKKARAMIEAGAQGITSNRAAWLKEMLKGE